MPWVLLRRAVLFDEYSELVTGSGADHSTPSAKKKEGAASSVSIWWAVGLFVALASFHWIGKSPSSQRIPGRPWIRDGDGFPMTDIPMIGFPYDRHPIDRNAKARYFTTWAIRINVAPIQSRTETSAPLVLPGVQPAFARPLVDPFVDRGFPLVVRSAHRTDGYGR
jgi:hypothetical protein